MKIKQFMRLAEGILAEKLEIKPGVELHLIAEKNNPFVSPQQTEKDPARFCRNLSSPQLTAPLKGSRTRR